MRDRWEWRFGWVLWVSAHALMLGGCGSCLENVGKGAAEELAGAAETAVKELPDIIDEIDELLANNIGAIDEAVAHNIQEASKALRAQLLGVQELIEGSVGAIDSALAARIDQLGKFARGLLKDVNDILAGRIDQITYSAERLITLSQASITSVLETAGFVVGSQVERAGKVVFTVLGRATETLLIGTALVVLVLVLVLTGLFFLIKKRPPAQSWVPFVSIQGLIAVGALVVLLVPPVRLSMAGDEWAIDDDSAVCLEAMADSTPFATLSTGTALSDEDREVAMGVLVGLYECTVTFTPGDLKDRAWDRIGAIERALGLRSHCVRNSQCDPSRGERCDVVLGLCTDRCGQDRDCPSGRVCHVTAGGVCQPACGRDADCGSTRLKCGSDGRCVAKGGSGGIRPPGKRPGGMVIPPKFLEAMRPRRCVVNCDPPRGVRDPDEVVVNPAVDDLGIDRAVRDRTRARVERLDRSAVLRGGGR